MTISLDSTYIGILAGRLDGFRALKNNSLYNFRCPICGDSDRNRTKRRGYFHLTKDHSAFIFSCRNCGAAHSIQGFIDLIAPDLSGNYKMDSFRERGFSGEKVSHQVLEVAIPMAVKTVPIKYDKINLMELPRDHPAVKYVLDVRNLPSTSLDRFEYVPQYIKWLHSVEGDPELLKIKEHPRLLIPYRKRGSEPYRYVARAFGKEKPKYMYTEIGSGSTIYNLDFVDRSKLVYVVEGQIDSMILGNSVAIGNAKYSRDLLNEFENFVIVPDAEPRNPEIVKGVENAISYGMKVCIWPSFLGKDINDMVLNGISVERIKTIIDKNTWSGPLARLKFNKWRRV